MLAVLNFTITGCIQFLTLGLKWIWGVKFFTLIKLLFFLLLLFIWVFFKYVNTSEPVIKTYKLIFVVFVVAVQRLSEQETDPAA